MKSKTIIIILATVILCLFVIIGVGLFYFLTKDDSSDEISKVEDNLVSPTNKVTAQINYSLEPDIYEKDNRDIPSWIKAAPNYESGPWHNDLYITTSTDGLTFTNEKFFVSHAGVPNIIQRSTGELIATFQYFSYVNEGLFDKIVYTISEDGGETWSKIKMVEFSGLSGDNMGPTPADPTLVELEDGRLRLYFTYQKPGDSFPGLYSATADSIDGTFQSDGKQLFVDEMVLDPAVIKFNGTWHHFTTYHEQNPGNNRNFHSTSSTGLNFSKQTDVVSNMSFLGDVIEVDGKLRFYGSGNGVEMVTSADGNIWSAPVSTGVDGADPGVVYINGDGYLMIYTGLRE